MLLIRPKESVLSALRSVLILMVMRHVHSLFSSWPELVLQVNFGMPLAKGRSCISHRERERERQGGRERERRERFINSHNHKVPQ
nr:unnamed protein product [Macaca fascicularis]